MGGRKTVKTSAKQGQETAVGTREECWQVEIGWEITEKLQTNKERRKEDTVSRGGLSEMGLGEMIGGSYLQRGPRVFPQKTRLDRLRDPKRGTKGGGQEEKKR